jgi:hypothetical protein
LVEGVVVKLLETTGMPEEMGRVGRGTIPVLWRVVSFLGKVQLE